MTLNLDKAGRVLSVDIASAAVEGIRRTAIVQTPELLRRSLEVLASNNAPRCRRVLEVSRMGTSGRVGSRDSPRSAT